LTVLTGFMASRGRNDAHAQEIRSDTVSRAEDAIRQNAQNLYSGECLRVRRN